MPLEKFTETLSGRVVKSYVSLRRESVERLMPSCSSPWMWLGPSRRGQEAPFPARVAVAADFAMKHSSGVRDLLLVSGFPQIDLTSTVPTVQGAVNMFVLCFEPLIQFT